MRLTGTTPQTASSCTTGTARMPLGMCPHQRALSCREHPAGLHSLCTREAGRKESLLGPPVPGSCGSARS